MALTLQDHLTDLQRLLHDSTFRFWSQQELTDYINKARKLIAAETGCTRQLVTKDIVAATNLSEATYAFDQILTNRTVIDVLDVLLQYNSTTNYQLKYYEFSILARTPAWQSQLSSNPQFYTVHHRSVIILPWPNIAYPSTTFDCAIEPLTLSALTDVENDLPFPYTECIQFYAAYLAKLKDQRRQEAEAFLLDYQRRKMQALGSEFSRRLVGA